MQLIYLNGLFLILAITLYTYLIFELVDTILENPKLKRIQRVPLGFLNAVISCVFMSFPAATAILSYISILVVLFIEFALFYNDTKLRTLFITFSCGIHIMALRAMCVSIFSGVVELSIHELADQNFWLLVSMSATFLLLDICILLVIWLIPAKNIKIINQHKDQLLFITVWMGIANLYFLFNAQVYSSDSLASFIVHNQIAVSVFILCAVYIVLFFTFKTGQLLNYKEKNDELIQVVENEQQLRGSIINDALSVYEVILSNDRLVNGMEDIPDLLKSCDYKYSKILPKRAELFVYPDDRERVEKRISLGRLLESYQNGKTETELVYRRLKPDGNYFWVKLTGNIYQDKSSKDVKAFFYVKDIHKEKLQELELKSKAERDSLTRLYNKGTIESLITEYILLQKNAPHQSALIIIDVDDFKLVNDTLGHKFGDGVLCELANRLRILFQIMGNDATLDNHEDIMGRIGGDEFIVFVKNIDNVRALESKAQQICKAFYNTYESSDRTGVTISCSIGIAIFPDNGVCFEDLYIRSDIALYQSKNKGKNNYSFYTGEAFVGYESKRGVIESE